MIKSLISTILILSLAGCIVIGNSTPKDNSEFFTAADIQQFIGTYKNAGDPSGHLSQLIWKDSSIVDIFGKNILHKEIHLINVSSSGNTLTVNAIKDDCIVYRQEYIFGRDFTITNGRIVLKKEINILSRGPGDVLVGPSYEKVELGVDLKGNGKYKNQTYFAGLIFLFLPAAGGGSSELKFEKLNDNSTFDLCKTR